MIRITSKKEGFMRCGQAHPAKATDYPDKHFSKEQMKALQAEPMLTVEILDGDPQDPPAAPAPGEAKTAEEAKARAAELDARDKALLEREKAATDREAELGQREDALEAREKALEEREKAPAAGSGGKEEKPKVEAKAKSNKK